MKSDRIQDLSLGGNGFSAVQFAGAAIHLLDAKHHAVSLKEMQLLLGTGRKGGRGGAWRGGAAWHGWVGGCVDCDLLHNVASRKRIAATEKPIC